MDTNALQGVMDGQMDASTIAKTRLAPRAWSRVKPFLESVNSSKTA